jgi:prophage regulatory protein
MRLLRLPDVCAMTGLPRSTVYALARRERCPFPKPIKLSERSSAWVFEEVVRWIEERTKASRATRPEARS